MIIIPPEKEYNRKFDKCYTGSEQWLYESLSGQVQFSDSFKVRKHQSACLSQL